MTPQENNMLDHKAIINQAIKEREKVFPVVNDDNFQAAFEFQDKRRIELTEIALKQYRK
jgi:hypothetical protein